MIYLKSSVKDSSFLFFTDESKEAASGTKRINFRLMPAMSEKRKKDDAAQHIFLSGLKGHDTRRIKKTALLPFY
ncbi:hypothetical protein ID10_20190 (plasmid) [Pantoea agglomerans]|jgi:hypothetical protein|nr:hypothetical protein D0A61_20795 [Pantoea agglomerans]KDA94024.1 hypothetical protein T296_13585 [Pantoea agglomerans Eh318]KNH35530.1 hypothetical protein ACS76_02095 [Pantoea vagans]KGD69769.1 hypothetical protein ID10_20190 [Pantoea agglomerans]KYM71436.1 hypothetical protein A3L21_19930 [Pantoea agglomerans]